MINLVEAVVLAAPAALAIACAVAIERRREQRRRKALNRALHDLRRPLHLLALLRSAPARTREAARASAWGQLDAALGALAELDAQINRRRVAGARRRLRAEELVREALERWRWPAALLGRELELRWSAGEAVVLGDAAALGRAIDNLLANSLEHGGTRVRLEGATVRGRLRIAVVDDARSVEEIEGVATLAGPLAPRPSHDGDPRRGHGLALSAGIACAHGGRLALSRAKEGTRAVLDLPLAHDSPPARDLPRVAA